MKIAHFISNLVFSFNSLLFIYVVYTDSFGTGSILKHLPPALTKILNKIITTVFSEYNIIGLFIIYGICILFIVLTVILFIKNLVKKQNVIVSVLSLIGIISTVAFYVLNDGLHNKNNPTQYQILCIFTAVIIIVQLIVSLIDTVKSYSIEYSE